MQAMHVSPMLMCCMGEYDSRPDDSTTACITTTTLDDHKQGIMDSESKHSIEARVAAMTLVNTCLMLSPEGSVVQGLGLLLPVSLSCPTVSDHLSLVSLCCCLQQHRPMSVRGCSCCHHWLQHRSMGLQHIGSLYTRATWDMPTSSGPHSQHATLACNRCLRVPAAQRGCQQQHSST